MKSREIRLAAYNEVMTLLQLCCTDTMPAVEAKGRLIVSECKKYTLPDNKDWEISKGRTITIPCDAVFKNKYISIKAVVDVWVRLYEDWLNKKMIYQDEEYYYFGQDKYPKFEVVNGKWSYIITIYAIKNNEKR